MAELRPQHEARGRERAMNNNNPEGYFFFTPAFDRAGRVLARRSFRGPATEKDAYHAEWNVPIGRRPPRSRVRRSPRSARRFKTTRATRTDAGTTLSPRPSTKHLRSMRQIDRRSH